MWTLSLYLTWVTLSIYLIPLLILIVLYTKICMTVWRSASLKKDSTRDREVLESPLMPSSVEHRRRSHSHHHPHGPSPHKPRAHVRIVSQAKLKTVKLTLVVIANYVLCYGPYFVSEMWAAWDVHAPFEGRRVHHTRIHTLTLTQMHCTGTHTDIENTYTSTYAHAYTYTHTYTYTQHAQSHTHKCKLHRPKHVYARTQTQIYLQIFSYFIIIIVIVSPPHS